MKRKTYIWTLTVVCALLTFSVFTLGCTETPPEEENDTGIDGNTTPENGGTGTDAVMISEENIDSIIGTEWQWAELSGPMPADQLLVPGPENYYLVFSEDGIYYFRADCNTGSGNYTLEGESLTLEPGVMTLVACGEDSLDSQYLASLNNVTSAATEEGQLILYLEDQENRMLFDNGGDFEQDSA
ncbi:META domain-containing protein [Methanolobus chelungpuianus]|uniref:DUF306 domain-containing protein n=1 Tax=Methanolobus chelungpuianus TaxID=502115 RepID=A0AAE3HAV3_9EURY|nr:META domain-containing protein [Methanolobus chelungpuianus]MCQ6962905.1 hypothetical protein [Methanolobus chelungpuianus]